MNWYFYCGAFYNTAVILVMMQVALVQFTVWNDSLSEQNFQGGASQSQEGANAPSHPPKINSDIPLKFY